MAAALPSGAVTFLFTDIAGSTKLLRHLGGKQREIVDTALMSMHPNFPETALERSKAVPKFLVRTMTGICGHIARPHPLILPLTSVAVEARRRRW